MDLLKRDNIKLEEVDDYHIYPVADNDTPKLSADRLEYSLSNALLTYKLSNIFFMTPPSLTNRLQYRHFFDFLITNVL